MLITFDYDRAKAVEYANFWAYRRNPQYLDFHGLGGDCTNFASQCLYAGSGVMNYTPVYGWFYITSENRTASWTGVEYLYDFLTGNTGEGPFAQRTDASAMQPGDIIQLGDEDFQFYHTLVVVSTGDTPAMDNILVAAHSNDVNCRPLDTYAITNIRYLHIQGVRKEVAQSPGEIPGFPTLPFGAQGQGASSGNTPVPG